MMDVEYRVGVRVRRAADDRWEAHARAAAEGVEARESSIQAPGAGQACGTAARRALEALMRLLVEREEAAAPPASLRRAGAQRGADGRLELPAGSRRPEAAPGARKLAQGFRS